MVGRRGTSSVNDAGLTSRTLSRVFLPVEVGRRESRSVLRGRFAPGLAERVRLCAECRELLIVDAFRGISVDDPLCLKLALNPHPFKNGKGAAPDAKTHATRASSRCRGERLVRCGEEVGTDEVGRGVGQGYFA